MSIIDAIIKANDEGRKVHWPDNGMVYTTKPTTAKKTTLEHCCDGTHPYHPVKCARCEEMNDPEHLWPGDLCDTCHDDMT